MNVGSRHPVIQRRHHIGEELGAWMRCYSMEEEIRKVLFGTPHGKTPEADGITIEALVHRWSTVGQYHTFSRGEDLSSA